MLNMLTVTQMLNQKVKVEKVDPFYPFHPNARTPKPADETRLLLAPGEADAWVDKGLPALVAANWKEVGVFDCHMSPSLRLRRNMVGKTSVICRLVVGQ